MEETYLDECHKVKKEISKQKHQIKTISLRIKNSKSLNKKLQLKNDLKSAKQFKRELEKNEKILLEIISLESTLEIIPVKFNLTISEIGMKNLN